MSCPIFFDGSCIVQNNLDVKCHNASNYLSLLVNIQCYINLGRNLTWFHKLLHEMILFGCDMLPYIHFLWIHWIVWKSMMPNTITTSILFLIFYSKIVQYFIIITSRQHAFLQWISVFFLTLSFMKLGVGPNECISWYVLVLFKLETSIILSS